MCFSILPYGEFGEQIWEKIWQAIISKIISRQPLEPSTKTHFVILQFLYIPGHFLFLPDRSLNRRNRRHSNIYRWSMKKSFYERDMPLWVRCFVFLSYPGLWPSAY